MLKLIFKLKILFKLEIFVKLKEIESFYFNALRLTKKSESLLFLLMVVITCALRTHVKKFKGIPQKKKKPKE